MDTGRTFFVLLLVKHQLKRFIAWQSTSLSSDILQLYFVSNFMPQFPITLWSVWLLLNTKEECTIKRPAKKTFLVILTAINKPYLPVLKRSGNFTYIELVCLTSREICPLHALRVLRNGTWYALSRVVETQAPVWPQNYHPLSLNMNNAINCNSLWTCSNSFILFGLANGRESFSVKLFYSNPGRLTFSQLPYKKNGTLRVHVRVFGLIGPQRELSRDLIRYWESKKYDRRYLTINWFVILLHLHREFTTLR